MRGSNLSLDAHRMSNTSSAFRGTAASITGSNAISDVTPIKAAGDGGLVLQIGGVPGWVLDQHTSSLFGSGENETAILARVPGKNIREALPIKENLRGVLVIDVAAKRINSKYTGSQPSASEIMPPNTKCGCDKGTTK